MDTTLPVAAAPGAAGAPLATPLPPTSSAPRARRMTDAQIRIIRMSVARTCTDGEFDHFIAVAERAGLDPLRRQISALVFSPHDPDKRSMVPLATIDGLRAIAARHGDYRPMEDATVIEFDEEHKHPDLNPLGIVRAAVKVWRRFDGEWFPITGEAWWDEYAALSSQAGSAQAATDDGARGGAAAVRSPGEAEAPRVRALAQNWRRMGRVLIAKCAEAQALRRGWPEDLSGLYGEEELHRAELDQILAHERVQRAETDAHQRALAGRRALLLSFDPSTPLQSISRSDLAQHLAAFIATAPDAASIEDFQIRNQEALRTFWEWAPGDALDIKRQAERAIARFNRSPEHAECTSHESGATVGDAKRRETKSRVAEDQRKDPHAAKVGTGAPVRPRRRKVPAAANQGAETSAP